MLPPTEKQIEFAEDITAVLRIDFPTSSKEFTKATYFKFISTYYDANDFNSEDEMAWFQMLNG